MPFNISTQIFVKLNYNFAQWGTSFCTKSDTRNTKKNHKENNEKNNPKSKN